MFKKIIACILIMPLSLGLPFAYALPEGEVVQSGSASFDRSQADHLNITTSDKVIIDYNSFNIGQPETVRFIQPNSSSIALNRVVGGNPSSILGNLQSNGQVMLINPNGILFGAGSTVDTGSFAASTLDISNGDFLSGNYNFAQKAGMDPSYIINKGHINASSINGYALLAAPLVVNEGTVNATTGSVNIAGTNQGTMSFDGRGLVNFAIPQVTGHTPGTVVVPTDAVSDIVKEVVNTNSVVEAGSIVERDGKIMLVGAEGLVINNGQMTANGAANQNAGRAVINSTNATVLTANSVISANGEGANSNGGEVKVLSSLSQGIVASEALAAMEAKGGASGDGGNIEFSGHNIYLSHGTKIDVSASNGHGGSFLLDPTDITVTNSSTDAVNNGDGTFGLTGDANTIDAADINSLLDMNEDVILDSNSGFGGNGDIIINAALSSSWGSLTLNAYRNITIVSSISVGNDLNLTAGGYISSGAGADLTSVVRSVTTHSTGSTALNNVTVSGNGSSFTANSADFSSGTIWVQNGGISINSTGDIHAGSLSASGIAAPHGQVSISSAGTTNVTNISAGTNGFTSNSSGFTGAVTADGNIQINAPTVSSSSLTSNLGTITLSGAATLGNLTIDGDFIFNGTSFSSGSITVTNGSISIGTNAGGINTGALSADGSIGLGATGGDIDTGNLTATSGAVNINATGAVITSNIDTSGGGVSGSGISVTSGGGINYGSLDTEAGIVTLNATGVISGGNIDTTHSSSGNAVSVTGTSIYTGNISTGSSSITLSGYGNAVGGISTGVMNGASGIIRDAKFIYLDGGSVFTGDLTINNIGIDGVNGSGFGGVEVDGTLSVNASGNVDLGQQSNAIVNLGLSTIGGDFSLDNGNNTLTVTGNVYTNSGIGGISLSTGTGGLILSPGGRIISGTGAIALTAGTMSFNALISGSGDLTLKAPSSFTSIGLGTGADATGLFLDQNSINQLTGFKSITIGSHDSAGYVDITSINFDTPVTVISGGNGARGSITLRGTFATNNHDAVFISDTDQSNPNNVGIFDSTSASAFINTGSGNLSITTDRISLNTAANAITGTGNVTLQQTDGNRPLVIGDAGGLNDFALAAGELSSIADGHSLITIGRTDGTGGATIGISGGMSTLTFNDSVQINSPYAGAISVVGPIVATGFSYFNIAGSGNGTTLNNDITTAGGNIAISDNVNINTNVTLTTANGGNIAISGTINDTNDNTHSLTLNGGEFGPIDLHGAIGNVHPLSALTITDSVHTVFAGAVTVDHLNLNDTFDGGTIYFYDNLNVTTGMTVGANGPYNISMTGNNNTIAGATVFNNTGDVTFGDGGDSLTFTGGVTHTVGTNIIDGNLNTSTAIINLNNTDLVIGNSTLDSSAGNITLGAVTLSPGVTLTLGAGNFDAVTAASISGTAGMGSVSNVVFNTLESVNVSGSIGTNIGALTINGTFSGPGGEIFQGPVTANTLSITGSAGVQFQDNLTVNTGMSVTSSVNTISITGSVNSIAGATTFNNTGTVTLGNGSGDATTFAGGVTTTGATHVAGTLATTNTAMNLGATTMTADTTLKSGSGAITLASITDGASSYNLSLGTNALTQTGTVTITGNATFNTLTTFGSNYNMAFDGTTTIDTATTLNNTGNVAFGNDGDSLTFTNGLTHTAGTNTINGSITSTNTGINLNNVDSVTGTSTIDAGYASGSITLGATTLSDGVTLTLGGGHTAPITVASLTGVDFGAASVTFNTTGSISSGSIGAGANNGLATVRIQNSAGALFSGPITANRLTINDSTAASTINFGGNLDIRTGLGAGNTANAYNITFNGTNDTIAGGTTLGTIGNVTFGNTGNVGVHTFTGGIIHTTGTNTINSTSILATDADITLHSADNVTFAGTSTIAAGSGRINVGVVTLGNTGVLALGNGGSSGSIAADGFNSPSAGLGNVTFNTTGAVSVSGNVGVSPATRIGTLTVSSANGPIFSGAVNATNVSISGITAASTVSFDGNLGVSGGMSVGSGNYNISMLGTSNTIAGNPNFSNSGTVTFGDGGGDAFDFTSGVVHNAGANIINSNITVSGGTDVGIDLNNTDSITGNSTLSASSQNIKLGVTTLADGVTLTLGNGSGANVIATSIAGTAAGAASNVTFNTTGTISSGTIGTDIGTLTVTNSGGATFSGTVSASTITLTNTTGTIAFQDNLTATSLNTASQGYALSLTGSNNTITNAVTFSNTGGVTLGDSQTDILLFDGGLTSTASTTRVDGKIRTSGDLMTLGSVTAAGSIGDVAVLDTTNNGANAGGSTITFGSVGGNIGLSLNAGTGGAIAANGNISGLTTLTVTNSNGATFAGTVSAQTIAITDTTDNQTVAFQQSVTAANGMTVAANGAYNVSLTGASNTIGGTTTFNNSGTVTIGNDATDVTTFNGGVDVETPSSLSVSGTIAATSGASTITLGDSNTPVTVTANTTVGGTATGLISMGAVTLADNTTLTVGAGAATPITLAAVTGTAAGAASNLTINTTGAVTVGGAVGTDIGTLLITNSGGTTFSSTVSASTITLTNTTGTIAFQDDLTATTFNTANQAYNVSLTGTTNSITNAVNFLNTGTVTLGNGTGDTTTFAGGVTTSGNGSNPSATHTAGTIQTNGQVLTFGPIELDNDTTLATTHLAAGGAALGIGAVTSNGHLLTLDSGASVLNGTSFAGGGNLTVTNSSGTTFSGPVTAGTVTLSNTTGTITFQNNLTATSLNTASQGYALSLTGSNNTITNAVTFSNTGGVTLGDSASDVFLFDGGLTSTASSTQIDAQIRTSGDAITLGALAPAGSNPSDVATLDTTNNGANPAGNNISLGSVNGDIGLALNAGTNGTISVSGNINSSGSLTVTNSNGTTFTGTVSASTITITDTTDGATVAFQNNVTVSTGMSSAANGAYNVFLTGTSNTIAGLTTFNNSGTLTLGNSSGDSTTFTGGVIATTPSSINVAGTISATSGASVITLGDSNTGVNVTDNTNIGGTATGAITLGAVTIADGKSLTVGTGIGNAINVNGVVGNIGAGTESLTLNTTGAVAVSGDVGSGGNPLTQLTITQSNGADFTGNVNVGTLTIVDTADNHTVSVEGSLTAQTVTTFNQPYNVSITGANNTITDPLSFANTGTVTIGQNGGTSTFNGGLTTNAGPSSVTLLGTIQTSNDPIILGAFTLGANTTIDTHATTGAADITLGAVSGGGHDLILDTGHVVGANISGTTISNVGNLTIRDVGTATVTGAINTNTSVAITDATTLVDLQGPVTTPTISLGSDAYDFRMTGASGTITNPITFANTGALILGQPGGTLIFNGGFTATAPSSVTIYGTILTLGGSITLGTVTLGSDVVLDTTDNGAASGGASVSLEIISGGGDLTVNAGSSGTATLNGTVAVGGDVNITGGSIAFAGSGSINANSGAGDVTLSAHNGGITSGSAATDITANNLTLNATGGIGASGNPLETVINNLQAENTNGDFYLSNTGDLNIYGNGIINTHGLVDLVGTSDILLTSAIMAASVDITAHDSILDDDDHGANDITTSGDARLEATTGTIGTEPRPLDLLIGGTLTAIAGGEKFIHQTVPTTFTPSDFYQAISLLNIESLNPWPSFYRTEKFWDWSKFFIKRTDLISGLGYLELGE